MESRMLGAFAKLEKRDSICLFYVGIEFLLVFTPQEGGIVVLEYVRRVQTGLTPRITRVRSGTCYCRTLSTVFSDASLATGVVRTTNQASLATITFFII